MKISTQEGYGLRLLLIIARHNDDGEGLTIAQISEMEDLSVHTVAKILRILRLNNFVVSTRGQSGGYLLARPANEIMINKVLAALGGRLFDESIQSDSEVLNKLCTGSVDCSIRSLWRVLQLAIDKVMIDISIQDLIGPQDEFRRLVVERLYDQPANNDGCKKLVLTNLAINEDALQKGPSSN